MGASPGIGTARALRHPCLARSPGACRGVDTTLAGGHTSQQEDPLVGIGRCKRVLPCECASTPLTARLQSASPPDTPESASNITGRRRYSCPTCPKTLNSWGRCPVTMAQPRYLDPNLIPPGATPQVSACGPFGDGRPLAAARSSRLCLVNSDLTAFLATLGPHRGSRSPPPPDPHTGPLSSTSVLPSGVLTSGMNLFMLIA
jgi:hypothetical protein